MSDQNKECEKRLKYCLTRNNTAKSILTKIEELGCKLPKNFISCEPCMN